MNQNIEQQYKTADSLNIRRAIHEKYSTNKQPFADWISEHYAFGEGFQILELGCGTGTNWTEKLNMIQSGSQLILSDFSSGMLETAKRNVGLNSKVEYRVIDIQDIPFPDASFDAVIANMMLYHVPDLHRGLAEVRRVLKSGGIFYCATYGEHGIMEFINDALRDLGIRGEVYKSFTLQNGEPILKRYFDTVRMVTRDDGLAITCVDDFVDYVMSMSSLAGLTEGCGEQLRSAFLSKMENGILYIPKEYGMFICK